MAKKPVNKTKTKATVGSAKKQVSNKKLLFMSLPIAAIVLGAGWFGWNFYQQKTLEAQAAGYTLLWNGYSFPARSIVYGCKYPSGTSWGVKVRVDRYSGSNVNQVSISRLLNSSTGSNVGTNYKTLYNGTNYIYRVGFTLTQYAAVALDWGVVGGNRQVSSLNTC